MRPILVRIGRKVKLFTYYGALALWRVDEDARIESVTTHLTPTLFYVGEGVTFITPAY